MLTDTGNFQRYIARTVMIAVAILVLTVANGSAQDTVTAPEYVGTAVCADCHEQQATSWKQSHHALAWTAPTSANILGDFDNSSFEHRGVTHRFLTEGENFFIEREAEGSSERFPVIGVAGVAPLQQYIVETEPGRHQSHDVVWDVEQQQWYHLYLGQELARTNGLHWTGPYKSWNARCAECHATGFEKRYDPSARKYASHQAEIGVGCEACHGPGSAHVALVEGGSVPDGLSPAGFTAPMNSAEAEIQQCAGCHSRREAMFPDSPLPGTAFHDSYRLALLRPGLYHPDGSIQDEVYVYGSFLQSKMYANGVRCSDCHDPHAPQDIAQDNSVCTACHSEAGNPKFPTLRPANYDTPEHHFHPEDSSGAQCKSCHMIERTYMGIDGRRDHSFRIPRPDLSEKTASPNACTDCHESKTAAWAAGEIATRFPNPKNRGPHYAEAFSQAQTSIAASAEKLFQIAESPDAAGIVRATALELLRSEGTSQFADRAEQFLTDADPLVRSAALGLQVHARPEDRVQRVLPLLDDELRSVRVSAARALLGAPIARLPERYRETLAAASSEFRRSLAAKSDFPETHLVLGGTALTLRNFRAAEAAFLEAVRLDPQLAQAWSMIVRIREALGDLEGARAALSDAIEANPFDLQLMELELALPK